MRSKASTDQYSYCSHKGSSTQRFEHKPRNAQKKYLPNPRGTHSKVPPLRSSLSSAASSQYPRATKSIKD
eukprot:20832-Heterococcus_DN1.PRE.2